MQKIYLSIFLLFILSGCLPVIFTGASASALSFAKDRTASETLTDQRIATAIKAKFIKDGFKDLYSKIKVEAVQGRVLFTGLVSKDEDAITAVQIAWDQRDVVEVINELKVDESSNNFDLFQYTRDSLITSQIKSKLFINRDVKFINYTIITLNDEVYLFGIARSDEELEKVAEIASNIHGVKKVISHVKVDGSIKTNISHSSSPSKDDEEGISAVPLAKPGKNSDW